MTIDEMIEEARKLTGYTPGPWRVGIDDDANPLSGRPGVFSSDELDCGIVHWDGFVQEYWRSARGDKEIHANARLIAAAPDLHRLALDLAAERERLLALALKAFTVVEWVVGDGYLLECPHEDADDLLLEMEDVLGVENSDEARDALLAAGWTRKREEG